MEHIPSVIFDMDGVILDTERTIIESWKIVAARHDIPDIEDTCVKCLGTTWEITQAIFYERYGKEFPLMAYEDEMHAGFWDLCAETGIPVKPGAEEILKWLNEAGIPVALASSTRKEVVLKELTDAGLAGYFREFVCGDMVTRSKPDPEIFLKAAEALKTEPRDCFVIEDSFNGVRAGHSALMRVLMVPDILQPTEEIRSLTEAVLPSLKDARTYIAERIPLLS